MQQPCWGRADHRHWQWHWEGGVNQRKGTTDSPGGVSARGWDLGKSIQKSGQRGKLERFGSRWQQSWVESVVRSLFCLEKWAETHQEEHWEHSKTTNIECSLLLRVSVKICCPQWLLGVGHSRSLCRSLTDRLSHAGANDVSTTSTACQPNDVFQWKLYFRCF